MKKAISIFIVIVLFLVSCNGGFNERNNSAPIQSNSTNSTNSTDVEKAAENIQKSINEPITDNSSSYNVEIDSAAEIASVRPWRYSYDGYTSNSSTVNVEVVFRNLSNKIIKYVYYNMRAYNAVGDYVTSNGKDESFTEVYMTGPFEPIDPIESKERYESIRDVLGNMTYDEYIKYHDIFSRQWENVWNNSTIVGVEARVTKIDFMDGTSLTGYGRTLKGEMDFRKN
jgi:hypothetical protein